jgi:hypothetical protein
MGKSLLGVTMDVVNGIWSVGTEGYKVVKNEVNDAIDNEAKLRTKEIVGDLPEEDYAFQKVYAQERKKVEKEAKELAVKGGLLAVGIGVFF